MPELPEVETLRRGVERELSGRQVVAAAATGVRSLRRHTDRAEFVERVEGRTLTEVQRRGKYLVLVLSDGQAVVAHMGMSGQLRVVPAGDPLAKHTHVVLSFGGGTELRFVDPRTFGEMWVTDLEPGGEVTELGDLGIDPLDTSAEGLRRLASLLAGRATPIKPLIMDQRRVAGIGNMYADEILFASRIHPKRPAASLGRAEVRRLHQAMSDVLGAAIAHQGSSLADEQYRDVYGRIGRYQELHAVYGRSGDPCPRCFEPVSRVAANGRSSYFCGRCQPASPRRSTNSAPPRGSV